MLLTGSLDATVCLWELNSGRVKQQWSTHSDSVLDVDWNDDQTFASASMDKSIHRELNYVCEWRTGHILRLLS